TESPVGQGIRTSWHHEMGLECRFPRPSASSPFRGSCRFPRGAAERATRMEGMDVAPSQNAHNADGAVIPQNWTRCWTGDGDLYIRRGTPSWAEWRSWVGPSAPPTVAHADHRDAVNEAVTLVQTLLVELETRLEGRAALGQHVNLRISQDAAHELRR